MIKMMLAFKDSTNVPIFVKSESIFEPEVTVERLGAFVKENSYFNKGFSWHGITTISNPFKIVKDPTIAREYVSDFKPIQLMGVVLKDTKTDIVMLYPFEGNTFNFKKGTSYL